MHDFCIPCNASQIAETTNSGVIVFTAFIIIAAIMFFAFLGFAGLCLPGFARESFSFFAGSAIVVFLVFIGGFSACIGLGFYWQRDKTAAFKREAESFLASLPKFRKKVEPPLFRDSKVLSGSTPAWDEVYATLVARPWKHQTNSVRTVVIAHKRN